MSMVRSSISNTYSLAINPPPSICMSVHLIVRLAFSTSKSSLVKQHTLDFFFFYHTFRIFEWGFNFFVSKKKTKLHYLHASFNVGHFFLNVFIKNNKKNRKLFKHSEGHCSGRPILTTNTHCLT